jgi:hypothetical protein
MLCKDAVEMLRGICELNVLPCVMLGVTLAFEAEEAKEGAEDVVVVVEDVVDEDVVVCVSFDEES